MFTFLRSGSVRRQMLLSVNAVLTLSLTLFLVIDFRHDWNKRIAEKHAALLAEAKLIAPVIYRLSQIGIADSAADGDHSAEANDLDLEAKLPASEQRRMNLLGSSIAVQSGSVDNVIEAFLRAVRDRNESLEDINYQVAVRIGEKWYQAKKSLDKSYLSPMSFRSLNAENWGVVDLRSEQMLVAGSHIENGMVYVAESLTRIQADAREVLLWRTLGLGLIGLGVTALIDLILVRLVSRPLVALVRAVRGIRSRRMESSLRGNSCREVAALASGVDRLSWRLEKAEGHRIRQLEKARRMQENLFPRAEVEGPVKIQCVHRAANIVGGDYYDHKLMDDGSVIVIMADVSGHGVAAAMGAAMLKTLFDSYTDRCKGLREIIDGINRGFHKVSLEEDFATMVILRIDPHARKLQFVNAGHETVYILDGVGRHSGDGLECGPNSDWSDLMTDLSSDTSFAQNSGGGTALAEKTHLKPVATIDVSSGLRGVRELKSNGPLVGVMPDIEWDVDEIPFEPGDRVVVYTDGITEARSMHHGLLGRKRFLEIMTWNQHLDLNHYCNSVLREVDAFRDGLPASDDVTMLAVEY